jgi:hypothetical protein
MSFPFNVPPSVACGIINTSPGSSSIESNFPSSLELNLVFNVAFTEKKIEFVQSCIETVNGNNSNASVQSGTYGNRQVFSTVTNGPYTHMIEF